MSKTIIDILREPKNYPKAYLGEFVTTPTSELISECDEVFAAIYEDSSMVGIFDNCAKNFTPAETSKRLEKLAELEYAKEELKRRYGSTWQQVMVALATKHAMTGASPM